MHYFHRPISFAGLVLLPIAFLIAEPAAAPKKKSSTTAGKKRTGAKTGQARQTWRNRQLQPTQQRYKEIQEALASKGYIKTEPNGNWDQESIEALRKFQQDQKLEPTGKIDSLSLIALGLGPKHEASKPN